MKEFIRQSKNATTKREIERLMAGEEITKNIRPELTYKDMYHSIENIWSVLLTTGYLTQVDTVGAQTYKLKIPNLEIRDIFVKKTMKENFYHGILLGILRVKEELRKNGVDKILKYGIGCYMKHCKAKLADS